MMGCYEKLQGVQELLAVPQLRDANLLERSVRVVLQQSLERRRDRAIVISKVRLLAQQVRSAVGPALFCVARVTRGTPESTDCFALTTNRASVRLYAYIRLAERAAAGRRSWYTRRARC